MLKTHPRTGPRAGHSVRMSDIHQTPRTDSQPPREGPGSTQYRFGAEDYGDDLLGHAAAKLADSAVAPIVAAARGYWRAHTGEGVQHWCSHYRISNNSPKRRALMDSCVGTMDDGTQRDMLVMPWHSLKALTLKDTDGGAEGHEPEYQIRPCEPIIVDKKKPKPQKYSWAKDTPQLLDAHPATPVSWVGSAPVVLFAEGLLKGDSALSAYLAAQGADRSLLGYTGEDAAEKLEDFMTSIPVDEQVLILRASSSTTFQKNPDSWQKLNMAHRVAWIGFDADVGTNSQVWRAANKLRESLGREKAREVKILSPLSSAGGKDGIDDYLSHIGDWWSLTDHSQPHLRDSMPAFPEDDFSHLDVDTWRITEDGTSTQRLVYATDDSGNPMGKSWVPGHIHLGAKMTYLQERREPTKRELLTGEVEFGQAEPEEVEVGVEVSWRDGEEIISAEVVGPSEILDCAPSEWRKAGARIPVKLSLHPQWPPRNKDGEKWVEALLRASGGHEELTEWTKMGWVPVEGQLPAFTVGSTVIAANEEAAATVRTGVDSSELAGFSKFGIGGREGHKNLHWGDGDDDWIQWARQARQDFTDLLKLYVTSQAWSDPAVTALVICSMFRPLAPVFEPVMNPRSTLYIYGPSGGGKSMTAKHIMAAWAAEGSDWSSSLPGSAESSRASMEKATSMAPIWAIDDLAPTVSQRQSEQQETAVSDVIRATFNAQPKQRMKRDMTTQKALEPRSQLLVTAENELSLASAAQRLVPIFLRRGALNPDTSVTEAIFARNAEDGLAARCSAHLVLAVLWRARTEGWDALTKRYTADYYQEQRMVRELLVDRGADRSKITRMSELIADLTIVMTLLIDADHAFGLGREWHRRTSYDPSINVGLPARWGDEDQFRNHIVDMMVSVHAEQQDRTPGRSMLTAIQLMLSMKKAHIASAEDPARPPYVTEQQDAEDDPSRTDAQVNTALGWNYLDDGKISKADPEIGVLVRPQRQRTAEGPIVLIQPKAAYNAAKRFFPEIILHGAKEESIFSSMWDEGICPPSLEGRKGYKAAKNSVRLSVSGSGRPKGIPIPLSVLLEDTEDRDDDDDE